MTIGLTTEHLALRDSVRGWADRHVTSAVRREAVEAKDERLPAYWPSLAAQGLLGLHLPEESGGSGYGPVELAIVLEELGRAMAPGPVLPTTLASLVLQEAGRADLVGGLADGSRCAAVGLDAGSLQLSRPGGVPTLTGTSGAVVGGQTAGLFVLPVRDGDGTAWVVLDRERVEVLELPSHDLVRRNVQVRVDAVDVTDRVLDLPAQRPADLAATLFAAEASGLADWCVTTASDYAKVRQQFGRPIGQFQGVKHRCARMLAEAQQAGACAWDAARAAVPGAVADPREAELAAAVAGALAPDAALSTAKNCIQTLGGIGFTWEHDAHLYLRRAHTLRLVLGPRRTWSRRVGRLALDGVRRQLDVDLPPEAEQVREQVRADLFPAQALPEAERAAFLGDTGFAAPHLPAPWGRGADSVAQLVIADELSAAGLRPADLVVGAWVVPTLIAHGSPAQQERFLPPTLRGELVWCQLFSEPGAGSDLAALSTRAEKVEGGWKLTGQKVWTSLAREAEWGICLARTDASVKKHRGISYFLVDMSSPGIDVRPLREITGDALFNEVFFDDVFVPDEMLVAEPGDGWKLARTTLANERVSLASGSSVGVGGEALLGLAADAGEDFDVEQLTALGDALGEAQSGALLGFRTTLRSLSGAQPGAESSIAKLLGVEHIQQVWQTAMEWQGTAALSAEQGRGTPTASFLNARCLSIAGGTTDVQLNIIGERMLGLRGTPSRCPPSAPSGGSARRGRLRGGVELRHGPGRVRPPGVAVGEVGGQLLVQLLDGERGSGGLELLLDHRGRHQPHQVAVDDEDLAADRLGGGRGQVAHEGAHPLGRQPVQLAGLLGLAEDVRGHLGAGPGADRVDLHAVAGQALRGGEGQRHDAGLGRGVVGLPGRAEEEGLGGGVDDPAVDRALGGLARRPPVHRGSTRHRRVALEVHADDVVPVGLRQAEDHLVAQHAGVVDQHVQRAELGHRGLHQVLAERPVAHVPEHGDGRTARCADLVDDGLRGRAHVVDHDRRPALRQRERLRAAEPRPGAGHDGDPAVQRVPSCHVTAPHPRRTPKLVRVLVTRQGAWA